MVALKLSKEGYGTPVEILDMKADVVLAAVHYTKFLSDYESAFIGINKKD